MWRGGNGRRPMPTRVYRFGRETVRPGMIDLTLDDDEKTFIDSSSHSFCGEVVQGIKLSVAPLLSKMKRREVRNRILEHSMQGRGNVQSLIAIENGSRGSLEGEMTDATEEEPSCSSSDSEDGYVHPFLKDVPNLKGVDLAIHMVNLVNKDFPNTRDIWVYTDRNIQGFECTVSDEVPNLALEDPDYLSVFLANYKYGRLNRPPSERITFDAEQLYQLVEAVTPILIDMSEVSIRIVENAFCRPMPPDEIFCLIASVCPSLGSPDMLKRLYYHALTDPTKEQRVNIASVLSGSEGCTAAEDDWLLMLLCPKCLLFGCQEHGYGTYRKLIDRSVGCSKRCFLNTANQVFISESTAKRSKKTTTWRQKVKQLVRQKKFLARPLMTEAPCALAKESRLSCSVIFRLQFYLKSLVDLPFMPDSWRVPRPVKLLKGTKPFIWKKLLRVMQKLKKDKNLLEAERCPYKPCFCSSRCENGGCSCAESGFCEKYCCCSDSCILRFPGCRCQTDCDTALCPCYKANRECDVDLCVACSGLDMKNGSCCSLNGVDETPKKTDSPATVWRGKSWSARCKNMQIQKGVAKHVYVAESNVHGLGVFAGERLKRGDFVCEYTGEIISRREADRRGVVYDYGGKSYLFTLDREYDIDATRFGNEARFINHCSKPNCAAQIKLVNGSHRIGMYATQNINIGEELFFDYRYSKEDVKSYPDLV